MFRSSTIIRELAQNLAKVIFTLKHSANLGRYLLCGCVAACLRPATSWVYYTTSCNTQSSASEDRQNNFPKHVVLTGIINKPLLLHLVGCLYYLYLFKFFEIS